MVTLKASLHTFRLHSIVDSGYFAGIQLIKQDWVPRKYVYGNFWQPQKASRHKATLPGQLATANELSPLQNLVNSSAVTHPYLSVSVASGGKGSFKTSSEALHTATPEPSCTNACQPQAASELAVLGAATTTMAEPPTRASRATANMNKPRAELAPIRNGLVAFHEAQKQIDFPTPDVCFGTRQCGQFESMEPPPTLAVT